MKNNASDAVRVAEEEAKAAHERLAATRDTAIFAMAVHISTWLIAEHAVRYAECGALLGSVIHQATEEGAHAAIKTAEGAAIDALVSVRNDDHDAELALLAAGNQAADAFDIEQERTFLAKHAKK